MAGSVLGAPGFQNLLDLGLSLYGGFEDQAALNRANAQNELRYGQGLTEAIGLRDRITGAVQNNQDEYMPWLSENLQGLSDQSAFIGSGIAQGYGNLRDSAMGNYNAGANQTGIGYNNLGSSITGQLDQGYGQLGGQYSDRTRQALSYLDGSGSQQLADIDERFKGVGSQLESDLTNRGLSSSTLLGSTRRGVERERSAEQRRLQEGLRREYLGAYGQFSGEDLAARERGLNASAGYGAEIGMAGLSAGERMNQQRLMNDQLLTNNYLGAQEHGMLRTYNQDANNIAQFGGAWQDYQNQAQQADVYGTQGINNIIGSRSDQVAPSPFTAASQSWQPMGGGGGGGGGGSSTAANVTAGVGAFTGVTGTYLAAKGAGALVTFGIAAAACVAGDAIVETDSGRKELKDVQVGENIKNAKGQMRRVVFRDFGFSQREQYHNFITITTDLSTITVTKDHVIEDKPAGEWMVGDRMRTPKGYAEVESIDPSEACDCGDFLLEDGSDYIASGFYCGSMLARCGCDPKDIDTKRA